MRQRFEATEMSVQKQNLPSFDKYSLTVNVQFH